VNAVLVTLQVCHLITSHLPSATSAMIDDLCTCTLFNVAVNAVTIVWMFIMNCKGYGRERTWLNLTRGSVVGCGTMLQGGRSWVRVPMRPLDFQLT
jgi:hypothetical protein